MPERPDWMIDDIDGCAEDFTAAPQAADVDLDNIVLLASVDITDADAVTARLAEWRELFPDGA